MKIEWWPADTLPDPLCKEGYFFIQRRFKEEWNITRIDVTHASIKNRDNIILLNNGKVAGWLGIDKEGEFTNACIEKFLHGTPLLKSLILKALGFLPSNTYFAYVPVDRTASARAFLCCGFRLGEVPLLKLLSYPEGHIEIVRMVRKANYPITLGFETIHNELTMIRRLKHDTVNENCRQIR
ncbi:MAG: hypothetical protein QNK40_14710 [Desulfobacterales bacterium]|nr:hypothetical protein [Desulfobacterales bacterium]